MRDERPSNTPGETAKIASSRRTVDGGGRETARRGQSEVISVALLVGIAIIAMIPILLIGGESIEESQADIDTSQAAASLTQLDSEVSDVALGRDPVARMDLGLSGSRGMAHVSPESGWLRVTLRNATTGVVDTEVANVTLGAVTYERDGTTIAYQGGGVWRSDGDGSVVVSRPEFHFEEGTLTLPVIAIESGRSGGISA